MHWESGKRSASAIHLQELLSELKRASPELCPVFTGGWTTPAQYVQPLGMKPLRFSINTRKVSTMTYGSSCLRRAVAGHLLLAPLLTVLGSILSLLSSQARLQLQSLPPFWAFPLLRFWYRIHLNRGQKDIFLSTELDKMYWLKNLITFSLSTILILNLAIPLALFASIITFCSWAYLTGYLIWAFIEHIIMFVPRTILFRWRMDERNLTRFNNVVSVPKAADPDSFRPVSPGRFPPLPSYLRSDHTPPKRRLSNTALGGRLSGPELRAWLMRDYEGLGGPKWDDLDESPLPTMKRQRTHADSGVGSSRTAQSGSKGVSPRTFGTVLSPRRLTIVDNMHRTGRVPPTIVEGDSDEERSKTPTRSLHR
ncbi:uncharacterized protein B0T15DRAFT_146945 [Chaetomium strumarium]|uniref:Uncharacterized protein n=1 Tax=Chaetomium strumarium TaxID=1170767 RepID=A0AAJ0GUY3_9PEZI|nr:hypothetical protein B0T15DRAFT_146945 [Chaetomium strumarium]